MMVREFFYAFLFRCTSDGVNVFKSSRKRRNRGSETMDGMVSPSSSNSEEKKRTSSRPEVLGAKVGPNQSEKIWGLASNDDRLLLGDVNHPSNGKFDLVHTEGMWICVLT
jgi:hypothetical protein